MPKFLNSIHYFLNGPAKLLAKKVHDSKCHQICIYGAGVIGNDLLESLQAKGKTRVHSVVDRKAEFIPTQLKSFEVKAPSSLAELEADVAVVIASEAFLEEMKQSVMQATNGKNIQIIHV